MFRSLLPAKSGGFCGFCPGFSSSQLDLYSEESWAWFWTGGSAGSDGGTLFPAGGPGLGWDEDPDSATGTLTKRACLSLGSAMIAICGKQVSPGVCSRPFKEQEGVPVLQGQGR